MKILVNCIAFHAGGTRTVGLNLVKAMGNRDKADSFIVLAPKRAGFEELARDNIQVITFPRRWYYYLWRIWFDQIYLPFFCWSRKIDIFLNLNNIPTRIVSSPQYLMLQQANLVSKDLGGNSLKELILFIISRLFFSWGNRSVVAFIVQSPVVAKNLHTRYGVPENKIRVMTGGFEEDREDQPEDEELKKLFAAQKFPVLCLSRYYPQKNLEIFLKVARLIREKGLPTTIFLNITADQHPGARKLLDDIGACKLEKIIINLGFLAGKKQVVTAYRRAALFVLPTLLESFSMTYLEAMRYGCPIATSDRDFAHYACGDSAIYFDPHSAEAILNAIEKVRLDPRLRNELVRKGQEQLKKNFKDWDELAKDYLELIKSGSV
jgi:glycosyltransferase involved in cell wall biosynthesis